MLKYLTLLATAGGSLILAGVGHAQVYDLTPDVILEFPDTIAPQASFGHRVDESNGVICISAPLDSPPGTSAWGSVRTWTLGHGAPVFQQTIHPTVAFPGGPQSGLNTAQFGRALVIDGDTMAVSSDGGLVNGVGQSGLVHILRRGQAGWSVEQVLRSPPNLVIPHQETNFGWTLAIEGSTLMVGAMGYLVPGEVAQGAVFVYERDHIGHWDMVQTMRPPVYAGPHTTAVGRFGGTIAIAGDVLVVGEPIGRGRAHIYHRASGAWLLHQVLESPLLTAQSPTFGASLGLDLDSGLLAIAELQYTTPAPGKVHLYEVDPGTALWSFLTTLTPSGYSVLPWPNANERFGWELDVRRGRVVVASPSQSILGINTGVVEVFEAVQGLWARTARFGPPLPYVGFSAFFFGSSLTVKNDRLVVGDVSWRPMPNVLGPGRAYVYELPVGIETCVVTGNPVKLNLLRDDDDPAQMTGSVSGLSGSGIGYFVAGQFGPSIPFGLGSLCVANAKRISMPQAFNEASDRLYASIRHPGALPGLNTAFQFVYVRRGPTPMTGVSSAKLLN